MPVRDKLHKNAHAPVGLIKGNVPMVRQEKSGMDDGSNRYIFKSRYVVHSECGHTQDPASRMNRSSIPVAEIADAIY